jgi:hypothetical protein
VKSRNADAADDDEEAVAVAIYRLHMKPVSRGDGRSATAASAYRSCSAIRDARTGELHDYTRKRGLEHAEIMLPGGVATSEDYWACDRAQLWNAAELAEKRRDSRVAREYVVAIPHELTKSQRLELVREFSRDLANRYTVAVDVAIHKPDRAGDHRNHHAHILTTTRALTATGMGAKTGIELGDRDRAKLGLDKTADELTRIRARWTELANRALEHAHSNERIDHRSLKDQGIEREPTKHMGPAIAGILARGAHSHVVERWQHEANERLRIAEELGQSERQQRQLRQSLFDLSNDLAAAKRYRDLQCVAKSRDPDTLRAQARAKWQQLRQEQSRERELTPSAAQQHQALILSASEDPQNSRANDHGRELILEP